MLLPLLSRCSNCRLLTTAVSAAGSRVSCVATRHFLLAPRRGLAGYQYNTSDNNTAAKSDSTVDGAKTVDLRSDVLSKPPPDMLRAMFDSVSYGDDVFGENTTVNDLEARVARMLGKPAALFVSSGTMGNLLPLLAHCRSLGSEVIVGDQSHIQLYEQGNIASVARVHHRAAATRPDGTLCLEECRRLVRLVPDDPHFPATRALCLENTHGATGGKILPVEYFAQARDFCDRHKIKLHVDGARLLNACVALNVEPIEFTRHVDTVTICFSKGLGAPVGSCIAADAETINFCRRIRKALGGATRQPGLLAAAANYSLDVSSKTLAVDHENAQVIYSGVARLKLPSWLTLDKPDTNILFLKINLNSSPVNIDQLQSLLEEPNSDCPVRLKALAATEDSIRMLTYNEVSRDDCEIVVKKFASILGRF